MKQKEKEKILKELHRIEEERKKAGKDPNETIWNPSNPSYRNLKREMKNCKDCTVKSPCPEHEKKIDELLRKTRTKETDILKWRKMIWWVWWTNEPKSN